MRALPKRTNLKEALPKGALPNSPCRSPRLNERPRQDLTQALEHLRGDSGV
jgi:hypothetical protein